MLAWDHIVKLGRAYEEAPELALTPTLLRQFEEEVNGWFNRIPVPVKFVTGPQPFESMGQMRRAVEQDKLLLVHCDPSRLGSVYRRHRAVHDYFGHVVTAHPFGLEGEIRSYLEHKGQYSPVLHPIIFSDVVLANAHRELYGTPSSNERYHDVKDADYLYHRL